MIETTDQAFVRAMHAAVAERGADYVYPREWRIGGNPNADHFTGTCRYAAPAGDQPGCLIGAALHRVGVPLYELANLDADPPSAGEALDRLVRGLSPAAVKAADTAQSHQDREMSWGLALEAFERELAEED